MTPEFDVDIEEVEPVLTPIAPFVVALIVGTAVVGYLNGKSDGGK